MTQVAEDADTRWRKRRISELRAAVLEATHLLRFAAERLNDPVLTVSAKDIRAVALRETLFDDPR